MHAYKQTSTDRSLPPSRPALSIPTSPNYTMVCLTHLWDICFSFLYCGSDVSEHQWVVTFNEAYADSLSLRLNLCCLRPIENSHRRILSSLLLVHICDYPVPPIRRHLPWPSSSEMVKVTDQTVQDCSDRSSSSNGSLRSILGKCISKRM